MHTYAYVHIHIHIPTYVYLHIYIIYMEAQRGIERERETESERDRETERERGRREERARVRERDGDRQRSNNKLARTPKHEGCGSQCSTDQDAAPVSRQVSFWDAVLALQVHALAGYMHGPFGCYIISLGSMDSSHWWRVTGRRQKVGPWM